MKKYETEVEKMSKELQHLKYEDGAFENLEEEVRTMKHEYNATKTQVQNQGARFSWLDFEYQKPEPNFNDSLVYGVAAKLFSIKNNKFTIALETAAGGKVSSNYSKNPHLKMVENSIRQCQKDLKLIHCSTKKNSLSVPTTLQGVLQMLCDFIQTPE